MRRLSPPAAASFPRWALLPQLLEEAGISATAMQHCGLLHFHFDDKPQPWEVHGAQPLPTLSALLLPLWRDCFAQLLPGQPNSCCLASWNQRRPLSRPPRRVGITRRSPLLCTLLWCNTVFRVSAFEGQPVTTDEMAPAWFQPDQVPFDKMWADDIHWCGEETDILRCASGVAQTADAPASWPDIAALPSLSPPLRYPLFLQGKAFVGTFHFKDTHTLVEHTLQQVPADGLHLPAEPL